MLEVLLFRKNLLIKRIFDFCKRTESLLNNFFFHGVKSPVESIFDTDITGRARLREVSRAILQFIAENSQVGEQPCPVFWFYFRRFYFNSSFKFITCDIHHRKSNVLKNVPYLFPSGAHEQRKLTAINVLFRH